MIPLKDDNITNSTPILSYAIIAICVAVFLLQISSPGYTTGNLFYSYGVVPASLLGIEALPSDLEKIDPYFHVHAWWLDALNWKYALYVDFC
ncbi:MAG: hypothetical protein RL765_845 [Pseudomonadota bacterium]